VASLLETQRRMAQSLRGTDPGAAEALIAPGRFGAARHLAVYRHNMESSLRGALAAIYPVVERLVGEGFFRLLAARYIAAHPSRHANLHELGRHLPAFLAAFEPAQALVYLPEVARLEWAWHRVFHAADAPRLPPEAIATALGGDPGVLRARLHPATRLVASPYPILRIWELNQPGAEEAIVDLAAGGEHLLLRRIDVEVAIERLTAGGFELLSALARGEPIVDACASALEVEPGCDVGALLQRHLTEGVIVDLTA
jgi:hypothetical protein